MSQQGTFLPPSLSFDGNLSGKIASSRRLLAFIAMLTLVVFLSSAPGWAQKDTGSIVGVVKDPSGAVVPAAKVTLTEVDQGTSFETSTNTSGEYIATPLKIGRYNVTVEKAGFKKAVVGPVIVDVQARPAVNVALQVGQVAETIVVTSQGPQLETETSDLGEVVNSRTATTPSTNQMTNTEVANNSLEMAPNPSARAASP